MAEWLYEAGIGENRGVLVENGAIVEAAIERPDVLRVGAVLPARLTCVLIPGQRGIAALDGRGEALLEPIPPRLTEGAALRVEIIREAIAEPGRDKLAKARASDAEPREGPSLLDRLRGSGQSVVELSAIGPDRLEQSGWSELIEEAATGEIPFDGGSLHMSLTPAMTLFDVDGSLDPAILAVAGAAAAARTIRRFGLGGSIGIDLPTARSRADRHAAAAAVDALLPQPFERTAVNGFGFLQIVRRRERAALPEILQGDATAAAARALLRRAERAAGAGPRTLQAHPAVIARLDANPAWLTELGRRTGAPVVLQPDQALAISVGHVHVRPF